MRYHAYVHLVTVRRPTLQLAFSELQSPQVETGPGSADGFFERVGAGVWSGLTITAGGRYAKTASNRWSLAAHGRIIVGGSTQDNIDTFLSALVSF